MHSKDPLAMDPDPRAEFQTKKSSIGGGGRMITAQKHAYISRNSSAKAKNHFPLPSAHCSSIAS